MPQMTNPETLRGKLREMREQRDYWRQRACSLEAEVKWAARTVRALLKARGAAKKWLEDFESLGSK